LEFFILAMFWRLFSFVILSAFISFPVLANSAIFPFFFDVPSGHKNFSAIATLKSEGIINGYQDGSFHPDQLVSRAEALKILFAGSQVPVPKSIETRPFPDVSVHDWFAVYTEEGKKREIIKGRGSGNFEPTATINRAEALKMLILVNAVSLSPVLKAPYKDVPVDAWFAPYFEDAKQRGIFDAGENDAVDPSQNITRGELAELIYRYRRNEERKSTDLVGMTSWYGGQVDGDPQYIAAHRTREIGSKIKVTDYATGKSVVLKITGRGPFLPGRILDISKAAFSEISDLGKGVTLVEIEDVPSTMPEGPWVPSKVPPAKKIQSKTAWDNITLDNDFITTVRKGETKVFTGRASGTLVKAFFIDPVDGQDRSFTAPIEKGVFVLPVFFENPGTVNLGIMVGESGSAIAYPITVTDDYQVTSETENRNPAPQNLRMNFDRGSVLLQWDDSVNTVFHIQIRQKSRIKNLFVSGSKDLRIPRKALEGFEPGMVLIAVSGAYSENSSSLHLQTRWSGKSLLFIPVIPHFSEDTDSSVSFSTFPYTFVAGKNIVFAGTSETPLSPHAMVIDPNGTLEEIPLTMSGKNFSLSFSPRGIGTHVVEISGADGIELVTQEVVPEGFFPILPNKEDLVFPIPKSFEKEAERKQGFDLVNAFRTANGISALTRDAHLDELAQFRADDMVKRHYFSHTSPDGKTADDIRLSFAIKTPISENISTSPSIAASSFGLEASASHRSALLDTQNTQVGIGIAILPNTKERVVVQIFSGENLSDADISGIRKNILEILAERRNGNALLSNIELEGIGNEWSTVMAKKGEHDFSFSSGENIQDLLKKGGVVDDGFYFVGAFLRKSDLLDFLKNDTATVPSLLKSSLHEVGIGITISPEGVLFLTLIGTE